eukprot:403366448
MESLSQNNFDFSLSDQLTLSVNYWCHTCKQQVLCSMDEEMGLKCSNCSGYFCEVLENEYEQTFQHPADFQPFQLMSWENNIDDDNSIEALSLENTRSPQSSSGNNNRSNLSPITEAHLGDSLRQTQNQAQESPLTTPQNQGNSHQLEELPLELERQLNAISGGSVDAQAVQNNEILGTILEMALQRIRTNNREFSNAVLTRAYIRVMGSNPAPSFRRRRLMQDFGSLYNDSPQGIFQDIIEDYIERPELPSLGSGGFFSNYIEQLIQQLSENDINRFGTPPASKQAIEALKQFQAKDFQNSTADCCVCQELLKDYEESQSVSNQKKNLSQELISPRSNRQVPNQPTQIEDKDQNNRLSNMQT